MTVILMSRDVHRHGYGTISKPYVFREQEEFEPC